MNRTILVAGFLLAESFVTAQAQTNELSAQTSEPPAQMQNSEAQQMMSDPDRTYYIAIWLKNCMVNTNKRAWSEADITKYCNCAAVTLADKTTQVALDFYMSTNQNTAEHATAKKVVQRYCAQKYLNLPDVSKIKDKKW